MSFLHASQVCVGAALIGAESFVSLRLPVLLGFHSSAAAMSVLCVLQYFLSFLTYFDAAQFSVDKPM